MTPACTACTPCPNPATAPFILATLPNDVETAFYESLRVGDITQFMACWADEDDIVCVLPGGPRLVGAAAIRSGFDAMLTDGGRIRIHPERLHRIHTLGAAVHNLLERVEFLTAEGAQRGWVIATNVYLKTALGWRLAVHHASPGRAEPAEVTQSSHLLH
jgi:ketosteroid isomerase-like protein